MRLKFTSLIAAVLLVAACETMEQQGAGAGGQGGATTAPGTGTAGSQASTQPSAPAPGSQADLVANVGDRVFFDYDKFDLKPEARRTLERQAAWLKRFPNVNLIVEGHADERGTREYNLALGERRANATKNFLVSQGIEARRLRTVSYGKERPVALGSNETAWAQNRRGVAVVQ
ncbi:MAG: peptidoglycan-associated lipoprotein Pal [Alphaproteobacteria bacterium]|nr:peptidoglycan-associated lipoprotein Pal [Alphaproteobacteria bacterium]